MVAAAVVPPTTVAAGAVTAAEAEVVGVAAAELGAEPEALDQWEQWAAWSFRERGAPNSSLLH